MSSLVIPRTDIANAGHTLNVGHPLTSGLVLAYVDNRELVSRQGVSYGGTLYQGEPIVTRGGRTTGVKQYSSGYVKLPKIDQYLRSIGKDWTLCITGAFDQASSLAVFSIGWGSSWANPYATLLVRRYGTADRLQVLISTGGTSVSVYSAVGSFPYYSAPKATNVQTFFIIKRGASVSFYRSGISYGSSAYGSNYALNFNSGSYAAPGLLTRHTASNGNYGTLSIVGPVFLWNRALSAGEATLVEHQWSRLLVRPPQRSVGRGPSGPIPVSVSGSITPAASLRVALGVGLGGGVTPAAALKVVPSISTKGTVIPGGTSKVSLSTRTTGTVTPVATLRESLLVRLAGSITPSSLLDSVVTAAQRIGATVWILVGDRRRYRRRRETPRTAYRGSHKPRALPSDSDGDDDDDTPAWPLT